MPDYPFELGENERNLSESFGKRFKGKETRALERERSHKQLSKSHLADIFAAQEVNPLSGRLARKRSSMICGRAQRGSVFSCFVGKRISAFVENRTPAS